METEGAEICHQERQTTLIAMARIRCNIGEVSRFRGDDSRSCLADRFLGCQYLRVRYPCGLDVLLARALVETRCHSRVQFESRIQRKPQEVIELRSQIGQLKFRGEYCLLTFEQVRVTLYRGYFEGSAFEYIFFALSQMLHSICALLFGR